MGSKKVSKKSGGRRRSASRASVRPDAPVHFADASRKIILDRLSELGLSQYWLTVNVKTAVPNTVYRYLRGISDTSAGTYAEMLSLLGLQIVVDKDFGKK